MVLRTSWARPPDDVCWFDPLGEWFDPVGEEVFVLER
jgi:hypothetical protein